MNINLIPICGICVVASILCSLFGSFSKEYSVYIKLAAGAAVLSIIILYITFSLRVNYQHGTLVAMIPRCPRHFTQSPTSWARLLLSPPSCVDNLITSLKLSTIKGCYHPPPHFIHIFLLNESICHHQLSLYISPGSDLGEK